MRAKPTRNDPQQHATAVERMLREINRHLDEEVGAVDDALARELFGTTQRVLDGLIRSYEDYQRAAGGIWRDGMEEHPT